MPQQVFSDIHRISSDHIRSTSPGSSWIQMIQAPRNFEDCRGEFAIALAVSGGARPGRRTYSPRLVEKCRKHGGERWDSAILQESKSFNSSVAVFYSLPKQALGPSTSRNGRRLRCCSCCSIAVYLSESDGRIKVKYDSPILPKQHPAVRRKILHSQIPGSEQLGQIAHSHQRPPCNDIWDRRGKFMLREVVDGSKGLGFFDLNDYLIET